MQNEIYADSKIRRIQSVYHLQTSCQEAKAIMVLNSYNDLIYPSRERFNPALPSDFILVK